MALAFSLGAAPALAAGVETSDSHAADKPAVQASASDLIPEALWQEATIEEGADGNAAGLSIVEAARAAGSRGRRRPGTLALSPPPAPAVPAAPALNVSGKSLPAGFPVASRAVTSGFGLRWHPLLGGLRTHAGVDIAAPIGAPVVATADGTVSTAGWSGGYGLLVAVQHGGERQTRYAHLSRLKVSAGQRVRKGDVIGYVGSTGRSTGPHLHYETRVEGRAVNPLKH